MDDVAGTKITDLSPVVLLEFGAPDLAGVLFEAYLHQVLADGFFHADPHPGNLLVTADGRLALIDLGMVARITPRMQDQLLQLHEQVVHGPHEVVRIERLVHDGVGAAIARLVQDVARRRLARVPAARDPPSGRDRDDLRRGPGAPQRGERLEPVLDRHEHVEEDEVLGCDAMDVEGHLAVVGEDHVVSRLAQRDGAQVADLGLIVDDENAGHGLGVSPCEW
jgi:hypothetical protein